MESQHSYEPCKNRVEHLDGRLRTSEAGSLYFYTATAVYEIRLTAFFADNLMNSVAHCGELPINVERPLRHIYELSAWLVTQGCRNIHELPERTECLPVAVTSPSVNSLKKWIQYPKSGRARLQATSMSPAACRKHRVCSTLMAHHCLRKYQHAPTDICLRAFCLYSKRQFLRKKYKNIRFCYVKSLYFRYTSKIKKFRTKIPDFGTFLDKVYIMV